MLSHIVLKYRRSVFEEANQQSEERSIADNPNVGSSPSLESLNASQKGVVSTE
ncbi:hypothetical protein KIN20_015500 [Parelaphostrongylus tenuis]|uniref:Uncharacterized protein n=1 Tax=Parelaphostrongylus tenuis TaxID=148309 RepID=A0AAD5MXF4_PARTN|nr:hypothetical protein KIN20_015500 [Parelaphostrongylus tenuis]